MAFETHQFHDAMTRSTDPDNFFARDMFSGASRVVAPVFAARGIPDAINGDLHDPEYFGYWYTKKFGKLPSRATMTISDVNAAQGAASFEFVVDGVYYRREGGSGFHGFRSYKTSVRA